MSKYIGALDQGTTSTRFIIFDRAGEIIASAQQEHRQIYPRPGWVEHDAREIWHNTQQVIAAALAGRGLAASDLAAIGITNQRETTVLWDRRSGEPLHPALVWQDTRVADQVAHYAQHGGHDRFRERTGLPLASYFSALKLRWLLSQVPNARAMAAAGDALFGTIDSWILWNLTGGPGRGVHLTDVTNASRTQLMHLRTLDWDAQLLDEFGIPRACLPRIVPSSAPYGSTNVPSLAGVPVSGMLGDQQAALVGHACFQQGCVKNTYGTGCFLLMNTGEEVVHSKAGLITTVAYQFGNAAACYALEGSVAVAGALVKWLRDGLGIIRDSADVEALASQAQDNGDVYFVPAFSGLYAPHWRADARGVIAGLTAYAGRAHIARAALEATAYQTQEVLAAMEQDSGVRVKELRVDGGMVVNELLMQFQADILDATIVRPQVIETTALGAAYAAGLAVGYWESQRDVSANWKSSRCWKPQMDPARRRSLCHSWSKAVARSLGWVD
ncbi:MAG: glycerol kinase GlpK [Proteobacteria bacterium]|nr:glycerol kinase GlpK [Pseudomonadota bacterium]